MASNQHLQIVYDAIDNASRTVKGITDSVKKNKEAIRKAGIAMGAFGAVVVGAAAFSVKAASNLEESINAVNVVFGEASGTILAFGETASASAGLSASSFNSLSTITGALLTNFGFSTQKAADETVKLAQRAADMASVFNTSVPDALTALNAALRGETEPIRRYAVDVSDAAIKAEALALGITSGSQEMTTNQKVTARLSLIYKQTAKTQGDFVNTAEGAANASRVLRATLENVSAQIGKTLIPIVQSVLKEILPVVEKISAWIKENEKLTKRIAIVVVVLGGLAVALAPILIMLPGIVVAIGLLLGPLGVVAAAVVLFGAGYATNFLHIRDITNWVVEHVVKLYGSWLGWFLPAGPLIKGFFFLRDNWRDITDAITKAAEDFVNKLISHVNRMIEGINWVAEKLGKKDGLLPLLGEVEIATHKVAEEIKNGFTKNFKELTSVLSNATEIREVADNMAANEIQTTKASKAMQQIGEIIPGVRDIIGDLTFELDTATGAWLAHSASIDAARVAAELNNVEVIRSWNLGVEAGLQMIGLAAAAQAYADGLLTTEQAIKLLNDRTEQLAKANDALNDSYKETNEELEALIKQVTSPGFDKWLNSNLKARKGGGGKGAPPSLPGLPPLPGGGGFPPFPTPPGMGDTSGSGVGSAPVNVVVVNADDIGNGDLTGSNNQPTDGGFGI